MKWSENTALFKSELEKGYKWQKYVASFLKEQGLTVEVPALTFRKTIAEVHTYKDLPDIICNGKVIEVKSRNLYFTNRDNFPYGTIFVDTVNGWKAKKDKPFAYICVSAKSKKMICLAGETHPSWVEIRKFDNTRKIDENFYECETKRWQAIESLVAALKQ